MPINYSAPIEIRDARNGSWFWIHTHVWRDKRLSSSSKVVYGTIASYANTEQTSFPSIERIAGDADISERHVYRCLKELEKFGYLKVNRRGKEGKANLYTLLKTTPDMKSPLTDSQGGMTDSQGGGDKSTVRTITNITRTNNNTLSKDNGKTGYGNQDINQLTEYFIQAMRIPKEDISQRQSRRYWNLLLKESKTGAEGVRWLIDIASADEFFRNNITSSKDLYYKRVKLIARTRGNTPKVAFFEKAT